QHGARRYHASNEIGDGRLAPLLANAQSGGITPGADRMQARKITEAVTTNTFAPLLPNTGIKPTREAGLA
ncbi:hypothetical protein J7393_00720, partial [Xanthomonas phaseoli pv. dieffenbachiae]